MAAELLPGVFLGMCHSRLNSPELTYLTVTIFELCVGEPIPFLCP